MGLLYGMQMYLNKTGLKFIKKSKVEVPPSPPKVYLIWD